MKKQRKKTLGALGVVAQGATFSLAVSFFAAACHGQTLREHPPPLKLRRAVEALGEGGLDLAQRGIKSALAAAGLR
jgi:hypothetical protein